MTLEKSATVMIHTLAQQKMASGIRVYNLGAGEPILPANKLIMKAVVRAMQQGKTLYPPVFGISKLRQSASEWMNTTYDCSFGPENCLVTNGGKLGIYLLLQLILQDGDEVIIASPYWVSYPAITRLFGGSPVIVETKESDGWKLTADTLNQACSSKTKILILNNGANPTGVLYSRDELESILNAAKKHNLLVISDEVYSELTYDNHSYVSCGSLASDTDNVIVIL
jgi:aspartate aminotransferase